MSANMLMTKRKMFVPESEELAKCLQIGLRRNFKEATVEWVDCPDLTQEPFNLTAPGLCGNEVLLEVGSISHLFPRPRMTLNYDFSEILKRIHFNHTNVSIIGAGIRRIGVRSFERQLGELFVNTSFSQVPADSLNINNQSRLAFLNQATGKCALESITDNRLVCYPYGNFFISEGKPGKVLKVQAKNCFGLHFLTAMECSLSQYSVDIPSKFVGLGGTFVMKNGIARTHVMPYSWNNHLKTAEDINNWLHYSDLNAPLVAVGTLTSDNSYCVKFCENADKIEFKLTQSHFHAYSSSGEGGHFYTEIQPINTVEYLGYFKPAKTFFHMNPHPKHAKFDELIDFNDMIIYW